MKACSLLKVKKTFLSLRIWSLVKLCMVRRESLFRLQGCSDNQLDSSECSSPKMEEIEQCSHVLQTTPSNKRKSSPRVSGSVVVGMMDLDSYDASRPPLSPLQYNSPESRMHKK